MAKNEFLPFGTAEGANVLSNQEYERLAARFNGFISGVAKSKELNTVWRQSSVMSSAIAQFIVDSDNKDLLDNGDVAGIKNRLVAAIKQIISGVGYVTTAAMNLEMNKKVDKANISGVKGNDNDKVPSLNLFTNEIGKLTPSGYSYSKLESDNKYQPKGNYAPAGNYATSEALKNGLDGKFDKTGGSLTGYLAAQKEVSSNFNGSLLSLITADESRGPHIAVRRGTNGTITRHNMPTVGGALMQVGDYGWGGIGDITTLNEEGIASYFKASSNVSRVFRNDADSTLYHYKYSTIAYFKSGDTYSAFSADYSGKGVIAIGGNNKNFYVYNLLHDRNTTIDRNGNLKASGAADHLSDCRVGCPLPWPQSTPPTGYLICNGQTFNKTTTKKSLPFSI